MLRQHHSPESHLPTKPFPLLNETRLKQSAGRLALGSVLTKCSPWAFAPSSSALGRGPREDHPALEKGRRPAAFFLLPTARSKELTLPEQVSWS